MNARTWIVAFLLAACSAERPPATRPIPEVDLAAMDAQTRARLEQARAELAPGSAASQGGLGMLYHAHDLRAAAHVCYANAAALAPDDGRWPYLRGVLAQEAGEADAARAAYEAAAPHAGGEALVALRCRWGRLELDAGRAGEAERRFEAALALAPNCAAALVGLGRCALARDDAAAAIRHLSRVLALYPEAGDVHYLLGTAYRKQGDLARAKPHLERGSGARTTVPLADPWLAEVRALAGGADAARRRGDAYLGARQYERAVAEYRTALRAEPGDAKTRTNLAAALVRLDRLDEAERELRAALDGGAKHPTTLFNLGVLVARKGNDEEAAALYEQVLALDPAHARSRFNLANACARLGRFDDARTHYAAVVPALPGAWQARVGEARMLYLLDRHADARARLEAALAVFPDQAEAREDLARLLAASPDAKVRDGARAVALADVLLAEVRTPRRLETAAMAHAEAGDFAKAVALQEEAARAAASKQAEARLALYRAGKPCREAWEREEILPSSR